MIKLSVLVTFCNQCEYVRRALDSILMQKVDFDYEVLIGLDGKEDGSEDIIREYMERYSFIKLYKMSFSKMQTISIEKAALNRKMLLEKAKGEFFTILDGDDFYGDELKFVKQLDVLRRYPKCIGCGSGLTSVIKGVPSKEKKVCPYFTIYTLEKYIKEGKYIHNGSIIFRNIFYFGFPKDFPHNFVNDSTMTLYMMKFGQLGCLSESTYMYQISNEGIYQGKSEWMKDLYGALGAEMNLQHLPEYRELLLEKYIPVLTKVYKERDKYVPHAWDVIRKFAKANNCRLVQLVLDYANGGYVRKLFLKNKIKSLIKNEKFSGGGRLGRSLVLQHSPISVICSICISDVMFIIGVVFRSWKMPDCGVSVVCCR